MKCVVSEMSGERMRVSYEDNRCDTALCVTDMICNRVKSVDIVVHTES